LVLKYWGKSWKISSLKIQLSMNTFIKTGSLIKISLNRCKWIKWAKWHRLLKDLSIWSTIPSHKSIHSYHSPYRRRWRIEVTQWKKGLSFRGSHLIKLLFLNWNNSEHLLCSTCRWFMNLFRDNRKKEWRKRLYLKTITI